VALETASGTVATDVVADEHYQRIVWTLQDGGYIARASNVAFVDGDPVVPVAGVRSDEPTTYAGTEGDVAPLQVDEDGALWARIYGTVLATILSGTVNVATHINENTVIHPSAAETATPTIVELTNKYAKGGIVTVKMTAISGGETVTPTLKVLNSAGAGDWRAVHSFAAISTTSTVTYYIHPVAPVVGTAFDDDVQMSLPLVWGVEFVHAGAGSATYHSDVQYLF
jgi:hypothetical protein